MVAEVLLKRSVVAAELARHSARLLPPTYSQGHRAPRHGPAAPSDVHLPTTPIPPGVTARSPPPVSRSRLTVVSSKGNGAITFPRRCSHADLRGPPAAALEHCPDGRYHGQHECRISRLASSSSKNNSRKAASLRE